MAGIDKTYTDSYKDYKEFKDWADTQIVTFFDGHTECIGNWVWKLDEKDFSNGEIPIMNTPTWLDAYLIQNCKIDFVINRMKQVYGEYFEEYKSKSFTKIPETFKQNRKIVIKPDKHCKYPFKRKMFKRPINQGLWWLQCSESYWYNDETKRWVHSDFLYPNNTNTSHHRTTKSMIKLLRKQYLPKGLTFRLIGSLVGEDYIVTIK
jgi:hypothetical protein